MRASQLYIYRPSPVASPYNGLKRETDAIILACLQLCSCRLICWKYFCSFGSVRSAVNLVSSSSSFMSPAIQLTVSQGTVFETTVLMVCSLPIAHESDLHEKNDGVIPPEYLIFVQIHSMPSVFAVKQLAWKRSRLTLGVGPGSVRSFC